MMADQAAKVAKMEEWRKWAFSDLWHGSGGEWFPTWLNRTAAREWFPIRVEPHCPFVSGPRSNPQGVAPWGIVVWFGLV